MPPTKDELAQIKAIKESPNRAPAQPAPVDTITPPTEEEWVQIKAIQARLKRATYI